MYYDDINKVSISGFLTQNAEVIGDEDANMFVKVSIATNKTWFHDGKKYTTALFTTVIVFPLSLIIVLTTHNVLLSY